MAQVGKERAFWGSLKSSEDCNSVAAEADSGPKRARVKPVPSKTTMALEGKPKREMGRRNETPVGS